MKQKIKKIVAVALLSMVVLRMTVPALSASAATGSVNGCEHPYTWIVYSHFNGYPNASPQVHQEEFDNVYECKVCRKLLYKTERFTVPHQQVPGTVYCVCGYYLR